MHILILEASTSSVKAMYYNSTNGSFDVKTESLIYSDVSVQNAEEVFCSMLHTGRDVLSGRKVDAIVLSGTWHSVMLCDRKMKPASPVYLWPYTGAKDICRQLRADKEYVDRYYSATGCMVNAIYPFFKLKLLKEQGNDLSKFFVMGQGSYNNFRMTKERTVSECMASGSGLFNINQKIFDSEILKEIGLTHEQLGRLTTHNEFFPLCSDAAKMLGVKEGIPVVPVNSDGGLNQIGSGAMVENSMTFSAGTSGALRITTSRPVLSEKPSTWCYLSPKNYMVGAATNGCCNCTDWFRNEIARKALTYEQLERQNSTVEDTPVFLPFIFGERCPGWDDERTGGFFDLKPYHSIFDMYRAVQEGILFHLYHCYKMLTELNGKPERIQLSGGLTKSETWTQMCADIFGSTLEIIDSEHASLLGGAVLAMEIFGELGSVCEYKPNVKKLVTPDCTKTEMYAEKYRNYMRHYMKTDGVK